MKILLPEIKNHSKSELKSFLKDYICSSSNITIEEFNAIMQKDNLKIVILIDEMEESFENLREKFGKGTKAPLRSTYEAINRSNPPYMTIMAYGMISVMESLRFDETGRIFTKSIPEIPPKDFEHEDIHKNFWW